MPDRKVAVITGTSSGIGLLTAIELAQNGYSVVATMRSLGRVSRREEATQKANVGDRLDVRQLDATDFDSIPAAIDAIVKDHGHIDVLVNNAGFSMSGFAEDGSLDELRQQFETNFFTSSLSAKR
jgi:NAD(P)-dependent dehydrogenase (short-subunit alcohol dehydrogenase family)